MKYKVIALSCVGKNGKIFDGGDTVTTADFENGRAEELADKKFLERIVEEAPPADYNAPDTGDKGAGSNLSFEVNEPDTTGEAGEDKTPGVEENTEASEGDNTPAAVTIDTYNKAKLQDFLRDKGIPFNDKDNKTVLFTLCQDNNCLPA